MLNSLIKSIAEADARIRPMVRETPVDFSHSLSEMGRCRVHLKLEQIQHTGSFKLRGAANKVLSLRGPELEAGVVAASTGNHGLGVCYAARQAGARATIYLPNGVSESKISMIRALGGEIVPAGDDCLAAELAAREEARRSGRVFISPYNDIDVIAGQGTIGVEMERQISGLDAVFISVGGGGLIAGAAAWLKSVNPRIRIVGCWPENSPVMCECLRAGRIIEVPEKPTLSESTAGGVEPGSITFDLCQQLIDEMVLVGEDEILAALRLVAERERWAVEGSAGVAVASFIRVAGSFTGCNVAILLCGRNGVSWMGLD